MEIKVKVFEVMAIEQVSETFKKREIIGEDIANPQYPEYIKFEAVQDRCSLLDSILPGDEINIHFNIKGRPWTDKDGKKNYFNALQLWKIEKVVTSISKVN